MATRTPVVKDQVQFPILMQLSAVKDQIAPRDLEFARSLVTNFNKYGRLSDRQMYFVEQIIARATSPNPPAQSGVSVSVDAILGMFERAAQTLRRVKVTLQDCTGQRVVFKKAGPMSKYAGQIMISDGQPFGQATFFGRILEDGTYVQSTKSTDSVRALVEEFAANPEEVAGKYGRLTGGCCFCSKGLKDDRSLEVGYGPVCAQRFGLKWGR